MAMNWADWVIVLILLISSIISLKRGFVKEALSLAVWIVAFIVATTFSIHLEPHFAAYTEAPSTQKMAAFSTLFIVTLLLGSAASYLLSSLVSVAGLSNADKVIGVFFGFARGILVILAIVLYVPIVVPIDQDNWWMESALIPYFLSMEEDFHGIISALSAMFSQTV